jgi:hypothetical protein
MAAYESFRTRIVGKERPRDGAHEKRQTAFLALCYTAYRFE